MRLVVARDFEGFGRRAIGPESFTIEQVDSEWQNGLDWTQSKRLIIFEEINPGWHHRIDLEVEVCREFRGCRVVELGPAKSQSKESNKRGANNTRAEKVSAMHAGHRTAFRRWDLGFGFCGQQCETVDQPRMPQANPNNQIT